MTSRPVSCYDSVASFDLLLTGQSNVKPYVPSSVNTDVYNYTDTHTHTRFVGPASCVVLVSFLFTEYTPPEISHHC